MLSNKALNILLQIFGERSNWNMPAGAADQIIEIREWAKSQLNPPKPESSN